MTELKPCPFCGPQPHVRPYVHRDSIRCVTCDADAHMETWQDAWAHKRIAELESKLYAMEAERDDLAVEVDNLRSLLS